MTETNDEATQPDGMSEGVRGLLDQIMSEERDPDDRRGREIVPLYQNGHVFYHQDTVDLGIYRRLNGDLTERLGDRNPGYPLRQALGMYYECTYCGEKPELELDETGKVPVVRAVDACPAIDGVRTEFYLKVPSGKIVVDDTLRGVYELPDEIENKMLSLNTEVGQRQLSLAMAAIGCAHGFVGNTCPGFYRVGEDRYVVANPGYTSRDEEIPVGGDQLAGICTDLWWYSIADLDDYVARGGVIDKLGPEIVEIRPGTYRFTHHTGERRFNRDDYSKPTIYADIERVE